MIAFAVMAGFVMGFVICGMIYHGEVDKLKDEVEYWKDQNMMDELDDALGDWRDA